MASDNKGPSLGIAFSIQQKNKKRKKMADGGEVSNKKEKYLDMEPKQIYNDPKQPKSPTQDNAAPFEDESPKKMAYGGKAENDGDPGTPKAKQDNKRLNKEDYMAEDWAGGPDVGAPPTNWGPDKSEFMSNKMADGGEVPPPCMHCKGSGHHTDPEYPEGIDDGMASVAERILARRRFAKGGEVDLDSNDSEGPGTDMSYDEDAKSFDAEQGEDDYTGQPKDSNEDSDDLSDEDEHDMVSSIRKKMKKG